MRSSWTSDVLHTLNRRFDDASPRTILRWAFDTFGDRVALGTGFGPSGVVLLHLTASLHPDATVFYLDTGLLFPETHALRRELERALGLSFTRITPALSLEAQEARHGPALWSHTPDQCCALRKVAPLRRFLADRQAWITGLRRDQASTRRQLRIVEWDPAYEVLKLNPLAHWTEEEVWSYIHLYDLPYNRLHDEGFPSIGCMPCTRAVAPGEDLRAGRWTGHCKTECGIHVSAS